MKKKPQVDNQWPLEVRNISIDENWFYEHELESCRRCNGDNFIVETSGPLTDWIQCEDCELWYPFAGLGETEKIIKQITYELEEAKK